MANIIIYCGKWEFPENPAEKPVFKCTTGTLENGVYTQFPGYDVPETTTVEELYNHLASNDDIISLEKHEMERALLKSGKAFWCGSCHASYMAVLI